MKNIPALKKIITKDYSYTFYNEEVRDYYHSQSGAEQEAIEKHAKQANIQNIQSPVIFDICFGLGYNTAAALELIKGNATIYCFENDEKILKKILDLDPKFQHYNIIKQFITRFLENNQTEVAIRNTNLKMLFGDAKELIKAVNQKADIVFFDPFDPKKVPEMWTTTFFADIRAKMKPNATLTTYSYAKHVRSNLKEAGFTLKDGPIIGRRSPSTIAIN